MRLKVNGKTGVRFRTFLDFRIAHKNVLLRAEWEVVIQVYNMSESTYTISSYEGCKILSIEYEEKVT